MSIILDIAIVLIFALTVYFAYKNGFVKTAVSAISFVLAIVVTAMFASPVAEFLKQTAVAEAVEQATEKVIGDALYESSQSVKDLLEGKSEDFNKLLAVTGQDTRELSDWFDSNDTQAANSKELLASRIAEPITDAVATVIAVVLLFIGTQIAVVIIARALDIVAKLPIIRFANKWLGVALGVVLAFFRVTLFCFAMGVLINSSAFLGSDFLAGLDPDKTLIYKIFSEIDIFSFFI